MMTDKNLLLSISKDYYKYWETKNIQGLSTILSDDIIIIDPIIKKVQGLNSVLEMNRTFFESCDFLRITELNLFIDYYSDTAIGEVKFLINDKLIEVVDIIYFKSDKKIGKIVAYLDTK